MISNYRRYLAVARLTRLRAQDRNVHWRMPVTAALQCYRDDPASAHRAVVHGERVAEALARRAA